MEREALLGAPRSPWILVTLHLRLGGARHRYAGTVRPQRIAVDLSPSNLSLEPALNDIKKTDDDGSTCWARGADHNARDGRSHGRRLRERSGDRRRRRKRRGGREF